jgi:very-short-patch-repair endonuclease
VLGIDSLDLWSISGAHRCEYSTRYEGNRIGPARVYPSMPLTLDDYLREHDGVITLAHAHGAGLSHDAVNRLVRAGRWRRCAPGVFFAEHHRFDDAARVRVAVWSYGLEAVASGLAAAWWLDLTKFAPEVVEVTVPRDRRLVRRPGTRLRRRDLESKDVIECRGLRVTACDLTVIEAASRIGGGVAVLDSALQRRQSDLPHLWRTHLRNKGRHGAPRARRMLQAASSGARSEAERLFGQLLERAGITGWKANYPVAGYDVDYAFPGPKVAVEIDGLAYHSDAETFNRDRKRQNAIALAGWQVLRFTWLDLTEHPDRVIATVRRAISGV